ncbi:hypothetical protein QUB05_21035 [Microcoleus sp. F10-C6]|uniref:hypothetical protein n=1 Tax=unclassified Microcoleus TaxID=2642155 RepID=UPI002FD53AF9
MAKITIGTGGTFKGDSVEAQLWEGLHHYQNGERGITEQEKFSFTKDDTFILSGSWSLPASLSFNSSTGIFTDAASNYLPGGLTFTPPTGGTIKGQTLAQYFLDCVKYAIVWQNSKEKNPQGFNRVTLNFNANELTYSGTIALPYTTVLNGLGGVIETATEWLTT